MHDPDTLVISSSRGRLVGRMVTRGVPALLLILVLGIQVANLAGELQFWARLRVTGPRLDSPDRARVLSAVWVKPDLYQITVRLTRGDGRPINLMHGIHLTDTAAGGYGEISDYVSNVPTGGPAVDVVAYQSLPYPPRGPLTLRIDGYTKAPRVMEPEWVRAFLGPPPPSRQIVRYPLLGGEVRLPAPPQPPGRKSSPD